MEFANFFIAALLILNFCFCCSLSPTSHGPVEITCKDHNGKSQQWFIAYKQPKNSHSQDPSVKLGAFYSFILSNSNDQWENANVKINDAESIIGQSISAFYQKDENPLLSIFYNDQPPTGPVIDKDGHSKGIILANQHGGLWLVHSVPHFPILGPKYTYPVPGLRNGQVFFCLTLNASQIDGIGTNLMYTRPHIYDFVLPESLKQNFPILTRVLNNERIRNPPWYNLSSLQLSQMNIRLFTKGPKFQKEIYSEWISNKLQVGLNVQSWLNGPNAFPSFCNHTTAAYEVHNILLMNRTEVWSTHSDHSKWAVSAENDNNSNKWICIGDLNRMEHQLKRGGLVLCMEDAKLWERFNELIRNVQPCPRRNEEIN